MIRRVMAGVVGVILVSCCNDPYQIDPPMTDQFYSPVDTPEKLMHNFQLAYETHDLDQYANCLDDEFQFILLEEDWFDYNQDGFVDSTWNKDIEMAFTENMFNSPRAEIIELELLGTGNTQWYGDATGATRMLVRSFDLKVYYMDGEEPEGLRAMGDAIFLCRPDENEEYRIWQWTDLSEE